MVAYKTQLQDTIAISSTESEFMAAYKLGKMLLYVCSILWDLKVPQEAASWLYENNNACTAMANAQKPTSCTRHMDIRYHVLCEWVEHDLIVLERVDTTINEADHFTKILSHVLFLRHIGYIVGHVPPEYSPAYEQSTGQFDEPVIKIVPDSYTTKETMPLVIPTNSDDLYVPIAARAARIYVRRNIDSIAICISRHAICILQKILRNIDILLNPSDLEEKNPYCNPVWIFR